MRFPLLRRAFAGLKALALLTTTIALVGCGGGGGGGGKDEAVIAPESLDRLQMNFFSSFNLEFYRLSGVRGNETGAVKYLRLTPSFRLAVREGNISLGRDIRIPGILTNFRYEYVRTSKDTGRVTLTWFNNEVYPFGIATMNNQRILGGDLFWGGPALEQENLVVDFLFTDNGGFIGDNTARVRQAYYYTSIFNDTEPFRLSAEEFDTPDVVSTRLLTGESVPTGYDPYDDFQPNEPSSAIWTTLQNKSVIFSNAGVDLSKVAFQATGGGGPSIPGQKNIEETGTILIDSYAEGVSGGSGTYSYTRTGGDLAKLALRYQRLEAGVPVTVELQYTLDFESLESGLFSDVANGITSGTFNWDSRTP